MSVFSSTKSNGSQKISGDITSKSGQFGRTVHIDDTTGSYVQDTTFDEIYFRYIFTSSTSFFIFFQLARIESIVTPGYTCVIVNRTSSNISVIDANFAVTVTSIAPGRMAIIVARSQGIPDIWEVILNVPAIVSANGSLIISNSLFVDEEIGSDITGTRERIDLPYQTLGAAATDAQANDVLFVRPGTYTVDTSITTSDITAIFDNGSIVMNSVDIFTGSNVKILGRGRFINSNPSSTNNIITLNSSILQANRVERNNILCSSGSNNIHISDEFTVGGSTGVNVSVFVTDGITNLKVDQRADNLIAGISGSTTGVSMAIDITNAQECNYRFINETNSRINIIHDFYDPTSSFSITESGSNSGNSIFLTVKSEFSPTSINLPTTGGISDYYFSFSDITTDLNLVGSDSNYYINADRISGQTLQSNGNGNVYINASELINSSTPIEQRSGNLYLLTDSINNSSSDTSTDIVALRVAAISPYNLYCKFQRMFGTIEITGTNTANDRYFIDGGLILYSNLVRSASRIIDLEDTYGVISIGKILNNGITPDLTCAYVNITSPVSGEKNFLDIKSITSTSGATSTTSISNVLSGNTDFKFDFFPGTITVSGSNSDTYINGKILGYTEGTPRIDLIGRTDVSINSIYSNGGDEIFNVNGTGVTNISFNQGILKGNTNMVNINGETKLCTVRGQTLEIQNTGSYIYLNSPLGSSGLTAEINNGTFTHYITSTGSSSISGNIDLSFDSISSSDVTFNVTGISGDVNIFGNSVLTTQDTSLINMNTTNNSKIGINNITSDHSATIRISGPGIHKIGIDNFDTSRASGSNAVVMNGTGQLVLSGRYKSNGDAVIVSTSDTLILDYTTLISGSGQTSLLGTGGTQNVQNSGILTTNTNPTGVTLMFPSNIATNALVN